MWNYVWDRKDKILCRKIPCQNLNEWNYANIHDILGCKRSFRKPIIGHFEFWPKLGCNFDSQPEKIKLYGCK